MNWTLDLIQFQRLNELYDEHKIKRSLISFISFTTILSLPTYPLLYCLCNPPFLNECVCWSKKNFLQAITPLSVTVENNILLSQPPGVKKCCFGILVVGFRVYWYVVQFLLPFISLSVFFNSDVRHYLYGLPLTNFVCSFYFNSIYNLH